MSAAGDPRELRAPPRVVRTGGRLSRRAAALVVASVTGSVLAAAAWLEPDPSGLGTHQQLNLPPCGWISSGGLPCPTCGMTTAFALAADGRVLAALATQPAGAALAIGSACLLLGATLVLVTGLDLRPALERILTPRFWWGAAGLILVGWGWKIALFRGWL